MSSNKLKMLFLGQYDLDVLDSAPKVRTHFLHKALSLFAELDFITGYRATRRWPLLRYLLSGKLSTVDGVYLEAATSTSMEMDFLVLIVARLMQKPVGIFIRDAHPMFQMVEKSSVKNRILILGWYISLWMYQHLATVLYYPSDRFAKLFTNKGRKSVVLPPGGRTTTMPALNKKSKTLLYSGGLSSVYSGIIELFNAIDQVYDYEPQIKLICVCREPELLAIQDWLEKPWLDIRHLQTHEIPALCSEVLATVICLDSSAYADLALPVKLFDYLSLGRPILNSGSLSVAEFVECHQVGLVSANTSRAFKDAIDYLFSEPEILETWASNAIQVLQNAHSWEHRAEKILNTLLD